MAVHYIAHTNLKVKTNICRSDQELNFQNSILHGSHFWFHGHLKDLRVFLPSHDDLLPANLKGIIVF